MQCFCLPEKRTFNPPVSYILMPSIKKNTVPKKSKARISHKVKDYGNDPFVLKKAKQSKEFLEKYGFPKELVNKK